MARAQDGEAPLEVHGFVSQGVIKSTDNDYLANSERGSFEFSEVGINFTKGITPELRVGMQLFMRDLGPIGNYQPSFDWYYLDYRFFDWLGMRAGRTKLPFGLYNETSDVDAARVPILLPQSIYPIGSRDYLLAQTGVELYGLVPLGGAGALEYRSYGGTIFLDVPADETISNFGVPYLIGARLMWQTPLLGLQAGGSVQKLRLDFDYSPAPALITAAGLDPASFVGPVSVQIPALLWVGSIEYAADELLLAAEYSRWHLSVESSHDALVPDSDTVSERFYGMVSYRLTPWFTPGVYYSLLFPDADDRSGSADRGAGATLGSAAYQHDVAATLRFDINEHWLVKAEAHYMHGTADLDSQLNENTPLSELNADFGVFLVKTTAYF